MQGTPQHFSPSSKAPSYDDWLPQWKRHLSTMQMPDPPLIPHSAQFVHTPLNAKSWQVYLQSHPNQDLVNYFLDGLTAGFRIGFTTPATLHAAKRNMSSATDHPTVVEDYLQAELDHNRIFGPYSRSQCQNVHVSRFGVIPKQYQTNKWRLIVDLSHPRDHSINHFIPKSLCGLSYITVDDAISIIMKYGPNTLLAKVDIKNAFRLIPVHPGDRHLLAMQWHNQVYVDGCLPFGLRSAPKLFNLMADLLSWIATQEGIHCILHYLDDFLIIAPPHSPLCQQGLDKFTQLCDMLGIPLASEKVEGPTSCLSFLGITLDTNRMEIRLPQDKLARIQEMLGRWLYKKKASKRKILSLVGLLQHATKVIRCGRTFTSRLYATAAKLKKQHFYTRLNRQFRSDVAWWHTFLRHWNGLSILRDPAVSSTPTLVVQTDASGSWGCGAVFNHRWLQLKWPEEWIDEDIMAKELVPVVLMVAVWGPLLYRQHVLLQCDNLGLVTSINKGSAKPKLVMHLLRCLWFFTAYYDIALTASHILGAVNTAADQLSRDYTSQFFITCPRASRLPTPIPRPLVLVLSPTGPDWTSPKFRKLFKATIQST